MSLNDRASDRCSLLPSTGARTSRLPAAICWAESCRCFIGRVIARAMIAPTSSPMRSTATPIAARLSTTRRTARSVAATLWVTRTAPVMRPLCRSGAVVARMRASSVLLLRVSWAARPASAWAISGRLNGWSGGSEPALSASTRAFASTTTTRPRTSFATLRTSAWRLGRSSGREQIGSRRREHVGLAARLRLHLGVDAPVRG